MSDKLLTSPKAVMNITRRIALEAGEIALEYFDELGFGGADIKKDGSPVTEADHKTEQFIEEALAGISSLAPVIGEESYAGGHMPDLSALEYFWLVDPIDGTKQFIAGGTDFTVNIALIHRGRPVSGVVFAPALGELYCAYLQEDGEGEAFRWLEDTNKEKPISVRKPPESGLHAILSSTPRSGSKTEQFLSGFKIAKTTQRASSLKMCLIAAGKADLYPRYGQTCYWDTAAAQVVLQAAGGFVTDFQGQELRYDRNTPGLYNPEFVAATFEWWS